MRTTGFLAPAAAREASWLSRWEAGRGPDGGSGRGEPQVRLSSSELCGAAGGDVAGVSLGTREA